VFRTDNEPFKYYMQKFTTYIVNLMKQEKLFASQGGPIILAQVSLTFNLKIRLIKMPMCPPTHTHLVWAIISLFYFLPISRKLTGVDVTYNNKTIFELCPGLSQNSYVNIYSYNLESFKFYSLRLHWILCYVKFAISGKKLTILY
jgi:hypothetical protein